MSERFDTFRPPPARPDPWETARATATETDDGADLDARTAAALLDETRRQAERRFDRRPPLLTVAAAVTVLIAYGAVWLSVRHQHPYAGPTGTALGELYGTLAAWVVLNVVVLGRALSGRSSRRRRLEAVSFATVWICVYVFQGALAHAGAGHGIVYGIWPAVGPLVVVGSAAVGYEVARDRRAPAGFAAAAVALGTLASFAGPAGVWGVIAVGLCVLLLAGAAAQLRERRAGA